MTSAALRERLGFKRSEWARVLNVHERTVSRWEAEDRDPGGTATAVMHGIQVALEDGADVDFVRRQLVGGIEVLVSVTLVMGRKKR